MDAQPWEISHDSIKGCFGRKVRCESASLKVYSIQVLGFSTHKVGSVSGKFFWINMDLDSQQNFNFNRKILGLDSCGTASLTGEDFRKCRCRKSLKPFQKHCIKSVCAWQALQGRGWRVTQETYPTCNINTAYIFTAGSKLNQKRAVCQLSS